MFPPVHPGVAYLIYSPLARWRTDEPPTGGATLALVVGAVLPDLVDQPLYYTFGLSSTRTLAHSLLVAIPVAVLAIALVRRLGGPQEVGIAFAVGYLSHPVADAVWPFAFGAYEELGFLLWPITHSPDYPGQRLLLTVDGLTVTTLWVELLLLVAALGLWWQDGKPGAGCLRTTVSRWFGR